MDKEGKGLVLHRGDVEYNVDKEGIRVYILLCLYYETSSRMTSVLVLHPSVSIRSVVVVLIPRSGWSRVS